MFVVFEDEVGDVVGNAVGNMVRNEIESGYTRLSKTIVYPSA